MEKKKIIMEYLSQFPISKSYQNIVAEAIASDNEKNDKVTDNAYRYALLLETNLADTKRGQKCIARLNKACSEYEQARTTSKVNER